MSAPYLQALPHPTDEKAWQERMNAMLADALGGIAPPDPVLPWDDDADEGVQR